MRQRPIDLLPEALRARSQAGVVTGRYVAAVVIATMLVGLTATDSRIALDASRQRQRIAEQHADIVISAEAKAARIRHALLENREFIRQYEMVALPLDVSRVVATLVNALPESATLDRIDLTAGVRRTRSARGRGTPKTPGPPPRQLTGELSGFAATDEDVVRFVGVIEDLQLFERVSLDVSRTRTVRGRAAREFRLSFRADLDVHYAVVGEADDH